MNTFIDTYILSNYNYWVSIILMMIGFYAVINSHNLIKKIIGLSIFQTSVLLLYISASFVEGAHIPILVDGISFYVNPLPHVLMLTAIVVGIATQAVGLALIVRIKEEYGSVEEDAILIADEKESIRVRKKREASEGKRGKKK